MSKTLLSYEVPRTLSVQQLVAELALWVPVRLGEQWQGSRTFFDTFDWRLYQANMVLEFDQSATASRLCLQNLAHVQVLMQTEIAAVPRFASEFASEDFRKQLGQLIAMRALLPVASLPFQSTVVHILNTDEKTVLRVYLEEYDALPTRMLLQIVKGYDQEVMSTIKMLQQHFTLQPQNQTVFQQVLQQQGTQPGAYSSKFSLKFEPEIPAEQALTQIFQCLLHTLQVNEAGCIANIDSEFLHDYRVAIRRTRVALGQLQRVFPAEVLLEFRLFFAWLGQITSSIRDVDVYLLQFDQYLQLFAPEKRADLEPLRALLQHKQQVAYQELAAHLHSTFYQTNLQQWALFLANTRQQALGTRAHWPVQRLADFYIWKMFQRVSKAARLIDGDSSAQDLHELRKNMKKLRYLLEFFHSLYPKSELKQVLKMLKSWQECLGTLQDYEVQTQAFIAFRHEMRSNGTPQATLLALGLLIQDLARQKTIMRQGLVAQLQTFRERKTQRRFKALFAANT